MLTYAYGGDQRVRAIDCPICRIAGVGAAVLIARRGTHVMFKCDAGCDESEIAASVDTEALLAELVRLSANGTNGQADDDADREGPAEKLTLLLGLHKVDLHVAGARVNGRGSAASADLYLSDSTTVTFEALSDFANTTRLAVQLAACAGVVLTLDKQGALRALTLLREIAEHHVGTTLDDLAYDWGASWLQAAEVVEFNASDQAQRWGAWLQLDQRNPDPKAGYAQPPPRFAFRDSQGWRYVRTSWFFAHARSQDPRAGGNPQIAARMERVGWVRRGKRGRMKATDPATGRQLWQSLFLVPPRWESPPDEESR